MDLPCRSKARACGQAGCPLLPVRHPRKPACAALQQASKRYPLPPYRVRQRTAFLSLLGALAGTFTGNPRRAGSGSYQLDCYKTSTA